MNTEIYGLPPSLIQEGTNKLWINLPGLIFVHFCNWNTVYRILGFRPDLRLYSNLINYGWDLIVLFVSWREDKPLSFLEHKITNNGDPVAQGYQKFRLAARVTLMVEFG